ncbi:hypothetical protein F4781DRAFT_192061 [Annulohypoxylon bovei var. microspora]|nr:hypothetical protein F4781DRAFT_192061 [Annulohypoxylon bovei var. microspora]
MGTVHAFGHRSKEDHYSWDNFHWRWLDRALNTFEVCYTLRFFEENHRGTGDPWSLRQTGIYQRVDYSKRTSRFILIQPSLYIEKRLRCKLHGMKQINSARHLDLFLIHITFLYATLVNWQNYITTQASELETLEEKSTFSKADYLDKNDYILRFADRQTLQSLRRHLLKAFRLLGCSIHVGEMLKKLCYEQVGCETGESKETLIHKLEDYIAEASYHRHIVTDLLQRSADTCELLTSLLQYRAGTSTLQGTNSLVQIAAQGEKDGKIAQRTSINAASLTFAATVYLPASLLAAIFSSNLVEVQNNHFLVAHEFWKFIVILIPMIIGTFALVAASQWYWMKWNNFRQRTTSLGNGKQSV